MPPSGSVETRKHRKTYHPLQIVDTPNPQETILNTGLGGTQLATNRTVVIEYTCRELVFDGLRGSFSSTLTALNRIM